jgi:hypothetical protein
MYDRIQSSLHRIVLRRVVLHGTASYHQTNRGNDGGDGGGGGRVVLYCIVLHVYRMHHRSRVV